MMNIIIFIIAILFSIVTQAQSSARDLQGAGIPPAAADLIAGLFTGGASVENNTYIKSRNQAGNANINVLKVDSTDDTVLNADSGDRIKAAVASTPVWEMSASGFETDTPYVAGSAPRLVPYTVTMAATPVAGTNDFKIGVNVVPTAAANTAALMPTPAAAGQSLVAINTMANAVRIKPGGTNTINGGSAGAYIPLAAQTMAECVSLSTTAWQCSTKVVPTPAGP